MGSSFGFFYVLRAACFLTGVLPIKKINLKNKIEEQRNGDKIRMPTYQISYLGATLWIGLFGVNYYIIIEHYSKFVNYANSHLQTCFQTNFCLQLVEKAIINIHPMVPLISIFYRFRLKLRCVERGECLFNFLYDKMLHKGPLYLFLFFQIVGILSYIAKLKEIPLWKVFIRCYRYIGVISLDCIIMTLCHTIGKTFEHINRDIDDMIKNENIDLNFLIVLEKKHWQTGNLVDDISKSFGLNSLFFWPYNIVHTITFLMFLTDARNHPIKMNAQIFYEASKLIVFLLVIVYCGWTGSLLTKEAERTKVCIERMKLQYKGRLDQPTLKLVIPYEETT